MTTTQTTSTVQLDVRTARQMGADAHASGARRSPYADSTYLTAITNSKSTGNGYTYGMYRAWLAGWDAAEIAASVEMRNATTDSFVMVQHA